MDTQVLTATFILLAAAIYSIKLIYDLSGTLAMNLETLNSITLSLPTLSSLLYSFDEFFGERPASLNIHDRPIFLILIIPYALGVQIRNADIEEKFFHIEFDPAHPDRADLWNSKAWAESLTKRLRLAGQVATYAMSPREVLRSELSGKLLLFFKSCKLKFSHAQAMTEFLISGPDSPTVLQLAGLPADISHLLQSYRNSNETQTEKPIGDQQD